MGSLLVYFDGQYWVGLFHRATEFGRVVFGSEPSDAQVLEWLRDSYSTVNFQPASTTPMERPLGNPKRRQRQVQKLLREPRLRTGSQQAWSAALEVNAALRDERSRKEREDDADTRYELRVAKKKAKAKGK